MSWLSFLYLTDLTINISKRGILLMTHLHRGHVDKEGPFVSNAAWPGRLLIGASKKILVALLLLPLVLASCTSGGNSPTQPVGFTPTSKASTVTVPPTAVSSEPQLAPVPRNCPISTPIRHLISSQLSSVIGTSPVWASWPSGPTGSNIYHPLPRSHYPSTYEPPYGWVMIKVVWEVGPHYTQPITVRGYDRSDHTPLLLQFLESPTTHGVLDPHHPDHPASVIGEGWAEWGSYIVVPKAGCYTLDVSWPTGHWNITFAFGA